MDDIKAECIFTEQVHVKEEEDNIKEELEWEDNAGLHGISAAAARAGLYVNHEVKDELVLGPEGVQPADIAFTLYACQASAAGAQPGLRDGVGLGADARRPETHAANDADVGNQVHGNANIHAEKEPYVCDICNKRFALKTQLMEHVMIHIHQEPEQEEIRVADNAARAPNARQHLALKDCVVRFERLEAGRDERLASCARRDTDIDKEIHGNIDISTQEETYICDTCKKRFPLKSQLVDHIMSHIQRQERRRAAGSACQASAARAQPGLRERVARRERHVANNAHVGNQVHSNANIHAEIQTYVCDICNMGFALKTRLMDHVMIHTHQEPEQEGIRVADNVRAPNARAHPALRDCVVRLERLEVVELEAGRDERLASRAGHTDIDKEILGNIDISTQEETYICDTCKKRFPLKSQLVDHIMSHIQRQERRRGAGSACQASAARAQPGLRERVARRERHVANNADVGNQVHSNANIHAEKQTYVCDICNMGFALKTRLMDHVMIHTHQEPEQEGIRVADNARAPNARAHPALRDCVVRLERLEVVELEAGRDERLASRAGLDTDIDKEILGNIDISTQEKTYICDTCKKWFPLKSQLEDHIMSHIQRQVRRRGAGSARGGRGEGREPARGGRGEGREPTRARDRRYACLICNRDFPRPCLLKSHERIHTGEKPFSCGICKKKFKDSRNLKSHELIHTGEKPFSCGICKKKFTQLAHLKRHDRTHTGEKPFACRTCNKKFADSGKLRKHERIHTGEKPFPCRICKKKFTTSTHLKKHEQTHTGEKPFACDVCKKQLKELSSLKLHKYRFHSEQRPFCCDICQKRFAVKTDLSGHIRRHMTAKPCYRTDDLL